MTVAQAKEKFFTETHEKFVELIPQLLKKLLDEKLEATKEQELLEKLIRGG